MVDDDRYDHLPAYLSNGVIGLRVPAVPMLPGIATVSGLEGEHTSAHIACVPNAPYPIAGDLRLGPAWLRSLPNRVSSGAQRYDFSTGELHTDFDFSYDGIDAHVEVLTFCCRSQPVLAAQEIVVTVDRACDLSLCGGVDPTGVPGRCLVRSIEVPWAPEPLDGALQWSTFGDMASCGVAFWTECDGADGIHMTKNADAGAPLASRYDVHVRRGARVRLRQVAAMVPSANHQQPHWQAARLAAHGRRIGFDRLREENAAAWRELWRSRVVLVGAERRWQELADAAFFYLHTSTHPGSLSTHPFGLAQWHGYHYYFGHVMWDVEGFLFPPLLLTNPDAALAMLDYRGRTLEAARENARLNGLLGLQFPWEASPSRGEESTPGLGPASAYEHHVTADVALAFANYVHATGDEPFRVGRAWPVLAGAADWLTSRGVVTERGWEIRAAMGIAEREEPADNPAFVNMSAAVALREAIACAERVGVGPPARWRAMADQLVLPVNRNGVILDHDGYRKNEEKSGTPAALFGMFPVGYPVDPETQRATTEFYLDLADDYVGSPMLSSLLGVWAAMIGDRHGSSHWFEEGYAKFSCDRFNVVHEYRPDRFPDEPVAGPFLANIGGFLTGCLYGLTGLRLGDGDPFTWCERPACMPDLWEGIEVERLWVRGRAASLEARHGDDRARITFEPS